MKPKPAPDGIIKKEIKAIQKQAEQLDPEDTDALDAELYKLEMKINALRSYIKTS